MPGLPGDRLDLDHALDDLGHLELEQPQDEPGVRAGHDDLRALRGAAHLDDVGLQAGAVLVALVGHLLRLGQQRLHLAEIEQRVAVVGLLDDPGDDVALAAGVLLVLHLALRLADALEDDLLGRLGGDAAEVGRGVVPLADDPAVLVEFLRDHPDLAALGVDLDERLLGGVGHPLVGRHERVGQSLEQDLEVDPLLPFDDPEGLHQLEVHPDLSLRGRSLATRFAGPVGLGAGPHSNTVRAEAIAS